MRPMFAFVMAFVVGCLLLGFALEAVAGDCGRVQQVQALQLVQPVHVQQVRQVQAVQLVQPVAVRQFAPRAIAAPSTPRVEVIRRGPFGVPRTAIRIGG